MPVGEFTNCYGTRLTGLLPGNWKNWSYLHTLSKTNIASGNVWLENSFLYGRAYFRDLFSFKEGNTVINLLCHLPLFVVMI